MKNTSDVTAVLGLMQEYPDLPVIPMVDSEIVGDDCGYWVGKWGRCEINEYYTGEERVHFRNDDPEDILNDMRDCHYGCDKIGRDIYSLSDEEWAEIIDSLPWVKCIVVYIELPE